MPYCPNCGTEYQEQQLRCACGYLYALGVMAPGAAAAPAMAPSSTPVAGKFEFTGKGGDLFRLYAKLVLLSIVSLGIYSFWGRTEIRKYLWSRTKFAGQPFGYHGTGKEIFLGWLALFGVLFVLFLAVGLISLALGEQAGALAGVIPPLAMVGLAPLAVHGAIRYRWSRTSWQGRRFQYRGEVGALAWLLVKGLLLTALTLSLYAPIFWTQVRRYITDNTWYAGQRMSFSGADNYLFWPHLKMILLLIPTLGMYRFWFEANMNNYLWGGTRFAGVPFRGRWDGLGLLLLSFTNGLIVMLTLGLGYPWTVVRRAQFVAERLELAELPRVQLLLGEPSQADAFGDAASQSFGLDAAFDWGFGL